MKSRGTLRTASVIMMTLKKNTESETSAVLGTYRNVPTSGTKSASIVQNEPIKSPTGTLKAVARRKPSITRETLAQISAAYPSERSARKAFHTLAWAGKKIDGTCAQPVIAPHAANSTAVVASGSTIASVRGGSSRIAQNTLGRSARRLGTRAWMTVRSRVAAG